MMMLVSLAARGPVVVQATSSFHNHNPILIDGDASFTSSNGVTGGSGTSSDPYVIAGWRIDASVANGIEIRNVDGSIYFIIRNVFVSSASNSHAAITLENLGGFGEGFESPDNIFNGVVANITLSDDAHGIVLSSVTNVKVASLNVRDGGTGIECTNFSEFNIVRGNQVKDTSYGVILDRCLYMDLFYNTFSNVQFGLFETPIGNDNGIDAEHNMVQSPRAFTIYNSNNNIIASNQISWGPGTGASEFQYGVNATLSDGISVTNNTITNTAPTSFQNGPAGVVVSNCPLDLVSNIPACSMAIIGNTISVGNAYGVALLSGAFGLAQYGQGIHVYHNNFVNNRIQAFDENPGQGMNQWDNGYPSGGNFWSDYPGVDNCSGPGQNICPSLDGIGDTPYTFNFNQDNYPLMQRF
jgi:hypothetical protein